MEGRERARHHEDTGQRGLLLTAGGEAGGRDTLCLFLRKLTHQPAILLLGSCPTSTKISTHEESLYANV